MKGRRMEMVDFARERTVNLKELAREAGVSMDTALAWRHEGLAHVQRGKTVLTTREEFSRFWNGTASVDADAELASEMAEARR
jgi:hypothetical protein